MNELYRSTCSKTLVFFCFLLGVNIRFNTPEATVFQLDNNICELFFLSFQLQIRSLRETIIWMEQQFYFQIVHNYIWQRIYIDMSSIDDISNCSLMPESIWAGNGKPKLVYEVYNMLCKKDQSNSNVVICIASNSFITSTEECFFVCVPPEGNRIVCRVAWENGKWKTNKQVGGSYVFKARRVSLQKKTPYLLWNFHIMWIQCDGLRRNVWMPIWGNEFQIANKSKW